MYPKYFNPPRFNCELCFSDQTKVLCQVAFTEPVLYAHLKKFLPFISEEIFHTIFEEVKFEVLQCRKCGFIWQKNTPNSQLMERIHNEWFHADDSLHFQLSSSAQHFSKLANENSLISFLLNVPPSKVKVLDYGMGWGERLLSAQSFGYEPYGVEISKKKIEHVQSKGINAFSSLDEIDQKFHFIFSYGVIDEVLDPVDVVKKLGRMLEKGGILKICVVNGSWLPEKFNKSKGRWDPGMEGTLPLIQTCCFTPGTLEKLGSICGLTKVNPLRIINALASSSYQGSNNIRFIISCLLKHMIGTRSGTEIFLEKQ